MYDEDDLLPISALQHLLFCPRQCALIHVEQLWADNALTVEGQRLHRRADAGGTAERRRRAGVRVARALPLRSFRLGLFGKADVVEFPVNPTVPSPAKATAGTDGAEGPANRPADRPAAPPLPVEYKRGKPKAHRADEVQLCAQALCLEEMLGVAVPAGALFYGVTRRRIDVPFDAALRNLTERAAAELHAMLASGVTPTAAREKKCDRCSLRHLCLPDGPGGGRRQAARFAERSLRESLASADAPGPAEEGEGP